MAKIWSFLALAVLLGLSGCAAAHESLQDGGGFGFGQEPDDFQLLQRAAGLEEDAWHEAGAGLGQEDARALWEALARTRATLQSFGPRRSLVFLLRQVLARQEAEPYAGLLQRSRAFHFLVVMRPDGYLVGAITGRALQRMGQGRVELRDGRLMVGSFEVGAFYRDRGGVFYAMDGPLGPPGAMVGELGLERDWLNAALDGTGDALGEVARGLAQLVHDPIRSVEGLSQLPSAVAALIASSPEYFARYSAFPLQEQIREAARLSTHLLLLYGSAGTAPSIGAAGARLPVLTLTAKGALAVEQVVLPAGVTAAAVGAGAGAVYVLMEAPRGSEGGDGFTPFTERNFRENLARLTGKVPEGAHAHHVFPQKLAEKFRAAGINVHDPRFGAWWERSAHLKKSFEYLRLWEEFFESSRSREQILQFGREMAGRYEFQVYF